MRNILVVLGLLGLLGWPAAANPLFQPGGAGSGEDAFTAESTPGTDPTATGTDAIGIGDTAVAGDAAGDLGALAIGARSTSTGINSTAIGENTDALGDHSIAIGGNTVDATSADATADRAIAIGNNSLADATNGIAIGVTSDAGGTDTIAIGSATDASATGAIAIGDNANATGANCVAIGGNATNADSADCSAADSVAIGQHVIADDIGEFAFASGEFATQSDAHTSIYVLRNTTNNATETELFSDGSAGDISIPSSCTTSFRINIVGRQTNATAGAGYLVTGVIDNNAGTTALVGSVTTTTVGEDVAGWDVTATADDTNDGINVLVTGAAADSVNWVARAEIVESCG